jgi:ribosomal protein S18 acetylase RimI-like enzyme
VSGAEAGRARVELVEVTPEQFPAWLAESTRWYAADMVRHALIGEADAAEKASADMAALLPAGAGTAGHTIAFVVDPEAGEQLGWVWFRQVPRASGPVVFVYQIEIAEPHRGRGLGRAVMLSVEQRARAEGATAVELNVFAGNTVARALYRSLGFGEYAIGMSKQLR